MSAPSRRLGALMCVAVVGVVLVVGLLVASLGGTAAGLGYAAAAGVLVTTAVVRGRHLLAPAPLPPGRTCTCCSTSQLDPVQVL